MRQLNYIIGQFKSVIEYKDENIFFISDREVALINSLQKHFPNSFCSICIWHLNKNILSNCKLYFTNECDWEIFLLEWNKTIYCNTAQNFEIMYGKFCNKYLRDYQSCIEYINKNIYPMKDKFAYYSVNQFLNFGTHTTSRVESAHHHL